MDGDESPMEGNRTFVVSFYGRRLRSSCAPLQKAEKGRDNMNVNPTGYGQYDSYCKSVSKSYTGQTYSAVMADAANKAVPAASRNRTKTGSVVDNYRKNHPSEVSHVNSQVNAGKSVLAKCGADHVSREDMTMEEYKKFFTELMNGISFDSSRRKDAEVWSVSEEGWEQMKNDPEYEAWVLGYTAENRSVRNPFASMPGYSPDFYTERFGASIEEHIGQSVPMNRSDGKSSRTSEDEKSWWQKRHERMEEILEEQIEAAWARSGLASVQINLTLADSANGTAAH